MKALVTQNPENFDFRNGNIKEIEWGPIWGPRVCLAPQGWVMVGLQNP